MLIFVCLSVRDGPGDLHAEAAIAPTGPTEQDERPWVLIVSDGAPVGAFIGSEERHVWMQIAPSRSPVAPYGDIGPPAPSAVRLFRGLWGPSVSLRLH